MNEDMKTLVRILRRALFIRMAAVRSGAAHEHSKESTANSRMHFSLDAEKRRKQSNYLWSQSVHALRGKGVEYHPATVQGRWMAPYRRRVHIEVNKPELRRVNDVLDRVRGGLLEALAQADYAEQWSTEAGREVGDRLLRALVEYDLPTVAEIADAHEQVKQVLAGVLGITDDELASMASLRSEEFDMLAEGDEVFGTYWDNHGRPA